jgi:hypothetical protein
LLVTPSVLQIKSFTSVDTIRGHTKRKQQKEEQRRKALAEEQKREAEEQKRKAEAEAGRKEQVRAQERSRMQAFLQAHQAINNPADNGQYEFMRAFLLNPFAYEGKVIAANCELRSMVSSTQGVFLAHRDLGNFRGRGWAYNHETVEQFIVASGLPKGFTPPDGKALLVGRVLGKIDMVNGFGATEGLPHLQVRGVCTVSGQVEGVSSHTCQEVKSR